MTYYPHATPWVDNPFIPGANNLSYLNHVENNLITGQWASKRVEEMAQFMRPEQVNNFNAWAKAHPTANIRTWAPLAMYGIDPYSDAAKTAISEDMFAAGHDGTYDKGPNANVPGVAQGKKPNSPVQTPTTAVEPTEDPDNTSSSDGGMMMPGMGELNALGNWWQGLWDGAKETATATSRATLAGLSAPIEYYEGQTRATLGNDARHDAVRERVQQKFGLTDEQLQKVDNASSGFAPGMLDPTAAMDTNADPTTMSASDAAAMAYSMAGDDEAAKLAAAGDLVGASKAAGGSADDIARARAAQNQGNVAAPFLGDPDADLLTQALHAYNRGMTAANAYNRKYGSDSLTSAWNQTQAGIIGHSLTDGVKGNLLTGVPAAGSVYDPRTQKWVNADDGKPAKFIDSNGLLVPSETYQARDENSVMAFDIRTPEEIKNHVAPVAWTLGRGIANIWLDPDQSSFYTVSGAIDLNKSLFLDPSNLIPIGWLGDAARAATPLGRAVAEHGKDVVVLTRAQKILGDGDKLVSATKYARPMSKAVAKAHAKAGTEVLLDPILANQGYLIEHDTGNLLKQAGEADKEGFVPVVNAPHAKFVTTEPAFNWITSAAGDRTVNAIAENSSPTSIWLRSNRLFPMTLAKTLAGIDNPETVRATLASHMGVDVTDPRALSHFAPSPYLAKVPWLGSTFGNGWRPSGAELPTSGLLSKAGRESFVKNKDTYGILGAARSLYRGPLRLAPTSGTGVNADDLDAVVDEMMRFFRGARIKDEDALVKRMDDLVNSRNGIERYDAIYGKDGDGTSGVLRQFADELVDEHGIDKSYAAQIVKAFSGGINPLQRQYWNSALGPTSFGTRDAAGEIGRPLLLNEMLSTHLMLPDYRTLRRVTGSVGRIARATNIGDEAAGNISHYLQGVTSVWRDLVLARPAFILRDLMEMGFSASLAGGPGFMAHPYSFLAMAMHSATAWEMEHLSTKAMSAPLLAAHGAVDASKRFLLPTNIPTKHWEEVAALPEHVKPDLIKGKSATQLAQWWKTLPEKGREGYFWSLVDKSAMADYLAFHEGAQWMYPNVRSQWARVSGVPMWDELQKAAAGDEGAMSQLMYELNAASGNVLIDEPAAAAAANNMRMLPRDDIALRKEYVNAFTDQKLARSAGDPLIRRLAKGESPKKIVETWRHSAHWEKTRQLFRDQWYGKPGMSRKPMMDLADITVKNDMDFIVGLQQNLRLITGNDPQLLDAIAEGTFDGRALTSKNKALTSFLREKMDDDNFRSMLPDNLKDLQLSGKAKNWYRHLTNEWFHTTGEFADVFGRSPLLRHYYSEAVLSRADQLTPDAARNAVGNLRRAGDYKLAKQIVLARGKAAETGAVGKLGVDEIENIAAGYARRKVAQAYYNAHRRQNYALGLRIIFPFIQATFNTFKRWGLMSLANPQMAYRTLKPLNALRQPGSAVLYELMGDMTADRGMQGMYSPGHPEASVDGFFYHNAYGDRMFAFPMVRNVYNLMASAYNHLDPVLPGKQATPLVPQGMVPGANVSGLNVAGTSLNPGMGPVLTLPAAMFLNQDVYHDNWVGKTMRAMFPYGMPDDANPLARGLESIYPTAFRKALLSEDDQANLTMRMLPTLAATGKYDLKKKSEWNQMLADAGELSTRMSLFSAFAGGVTPTTINWAPMIDVSKGDKYGALGVFMVQDKLADEYRKYTAPKSAATADQDYNNGALRFLKDYGIYALYSVMPRTTMDDPTTISTSPTADVWSFRTEQPDTYNKYKQVIGLFFPGGDPMSEWSTGQQNLYAWQKTAGERRSMSPVEWRASVNQSIGWLLYSAKVQEINSTIPDSDEQAYATRQAAENIEQKFPDWTPTAGDSQANFDLAIDEMKEAVKDPVMQTLPGTGPIADYLKARDDAIQSLTERGYAGTLSAQYATVQRAQLNQLKTTLIRNDPTGTFAYAWTRLFSRELEVDQ